jgi:hypothetical protein
LANILFAQVDNEKEKAFISEAANDVCDCITEKKPNSKSDLQTLLGTCFLEVVLGKKADKFNAVYGTEWMSKSQEEINSQFHEFGRKLGMELVIQNCEIFVQISKDAMQTETAKQNDSGKYKSSVIVRKTGTDFAPYLLIEDNSGTSKYYLVNDDEENPTLNVNFDMLKNKIVNITFGFKNIYNPKSKQFERVRTLINISL